MKIYNYDSETGEYLSSGVADADPLQEGNWLIPANANVTAPPAVTSGSVAVFSAGTWSVMPDHRGEKWWNTAGDEYVINTIGDPAAVGLVDQLPQQLVLEKIAVSAKEKAGRRIVAVLKDDKTQRNMTALAASLIRKESLSTITAAEQATLDLLDAAQSWVAATQTVGRNLAANLDPTYADAAHWPAPPAGLDALVAQL